MSETIMIVLIIAGTILTILFLFRRQLSEFVFRLSRDGIDTELRTHSKTATSEDRTAGGQSSSVVPGVRVRGNKVIGRRQKMKVEREADVTNNLLLGEDQTLAVTSDNPQIVHLYQEITNNFSRNDLRVLCQHLNFNYDDLPGTDLESKTHALIEEMHQKQSLPLLITEARRLYPELSLEHDAR
jgi:hypothetical protein